MSPISKILTSLNIPLGAIPGVVSKDTTKVVVMFHLVTSPTFIVGRIKKISYEDWIEEHGHSETIEIEIECSENDGTLSKELRDDTWTWQSSNTHGNNIEVIKDSLVFFYADPDFFKPQQTN